MRKEHLIFEILIPRFVAQSTIFFMQTMHWTSDSAFKFLLLSMPFVAFLILANPTHLCQHVLHSAIIGCFVNAEFVSHHKFLQPRKLGDSLHHFVCLLITTNQQTLQHLGFTLPGNYRFYRGNYPDSRVLTLVT